MDILAEMPKFPERQVYVYKLQSLLRSSFSGSFAGLVHL